jgi:hypothetical protein
MVVFCTEKDCKIRASFGFTGESRTKCTLHKLLGMRNLAVNKCSEEGCTTSNYNYPHLKGGVYCGKHRKEGMINVTGKKCAFAGCLISPAFNIPSQKRGLYCNTHKLDGMINVIIPRCIELGCSVTPSYNKVGIKKPIYCASHKKDQMVVVVKYRTCSFIGCKTRATFINKDEGGIPTHCAKHKTSTMISISNNVCKSCLKRASYNYYGESVPIYCNLHKSEGMINIKDSKCLEPGCMIIPSFNFSGKKKGIYCRLHKKLDMLNVREKTCKIVHCTTQVGNDKYSGYCLNCFMHLFPEKPVCRNYKTKEKAVRDFIRSSYPTLTWTFDMRMVDGKSLRRPDAVLDLSSHAIIVEVDENQHISYDCSCENKRLMELSLDLNHKPLTFIRFNPDSYVDISGSFMKTCWKIDGNGILRVHKEDLPNWTSRLNSLKEAIDYWITNPTDKTVNVIQLYFDKLV